MFKNKISKFVVLTLITACAFLSLGMLKAEAKQDYWVGTFQLVWNDLMDEIIKGPVQFKGGNPRLANELNKQKFKADMISQDSYYKICAKKNKELKAKIEKDIMEKFNEKSDILDKFDWTEKPNDAYFLYAMLKKDFEFLEPFKVLPPAKFDNSKFDVKYFGIDSSAPAKMKKNVRVLFYDSNKEYAVALKSKENEEVILYRTNRNGDFDAVFERLQKKSPSTLPKFQHNDTLKVPFVSIKTEESFDELCNKEIKNSDRLYIRQALQTVEFYMDNKGGKLKSEAAMDIATMSLRVEKGRNYNFDKKFYLFLKEDNKSKPYFAMKIDNADYLVKE